MTKRDDYLWDPDAEPDADVAEFERALAAKRWRGDVPAAPNRRRPILLRRLIAVAAGALALAVAGRFYLDERSGPGYSYEVLRGTPRIEGGRAAGGALLRAGQRLVCDADAAVTLDIGSIGSVELGPESRLRVEDPGAGAEGAEHLLFLERGTLTASIFAAPRLFQVGTPAGIAVDLGCIYSATVEEDGATRLSVDAGFVSFEAEGRRVLVPADASCRAWPGRGPGTPSWDRKGEAWRAAVERLDAREGAAEPALDLLLATEDPEDSLTLWHLLDHEDDTVRTRVFDRLVAVAPLPAGVSGAACRQGERASLDAWRASFEWSW